MATAVVQVELSETLPQLRVDPRYSRAFVVGRYAGRAVGHAILQAAGGIVDPEALMDHAAGWVTSLGADLLRPELRPRPEPAGPAPSVTVAIPSRERPDDLRRCLAALAPARARGHEVLVVDNDRRSPGPTASVVAEFPGVRLVRETAPGASAARNRAVAEAEGEVICFTDDDAVPEPGWIDALVAHFADPMVWCVTGLTLPLELETNGQELFEQHSTLGRGYAPRRFRGAAMDPLEIGHIGASVNMATRRLAFGVTGPFDTALGPGSPARAAEDYHFFTGILAAGLHIAYEPGAVVWHRHRREMDELSSIFFAYSAGVYAFLMRTLLLDREPTALRQGWRWFSRHQIPSLRNALLGDPAELPVACRLAEMRGLASAPWLYVSGRLRRGRQ